MSRPRKLNPTAVYSLADQGFSHRDVAAKLGTSHTAVANVLKARPASAGNVASPTDLANLANPIDGKAPLVERLNDLASMLSEVDLESAKVIWEAVSALATVAASFEPEEDDLPDPSQPLDMRATLRAMIRRHTKDHDRWVAVGNAMAATRDSRTVAILAAQLSRLEREARDDGQMLHFSKTELDAAQASVDERLRKLCDRPLLCAGCNRELSVAWAENREPIYQRPANPAGK